jgi:hypothetical protein
MPCNKGKHLLMGRIDQRRVSKPLCPRWEFLVEFLVSSEVVELSQLRKNEQSHRRCRRCTPKSLEATTDIFCQLSKWIDEHRFPTQVSLKDTVTRRRMRKVTVRVETLVISTTFQREFKLCVHRFESRVNQ